VWSLRLSDKPAKGIRPPQAPSWHASNGLQVDVEPRVEGGLLRRVHVAADPNTMNCTGVTICACEGEHAPKTNEARAIKKIK
jgi:hypothetical protein